MAKTKKTLEKFYDLMIPILMEGTKTGVLRDEVNVNFVENKAKDTIKSARNVEICKAIADIEGFTLPE